MSDCARRARRGERRRHDLLPPLPRSRRLDRAVRGLPRHLASRHARNGRVDHHDVAGIRQADGADRDAGQIGDAGSARCRRQTVGAPQAAVLRQRAERQGPRHPARLFDRARRSRLSARGDRRDPARLPDRHVAADEQGARSVHPGAEADLAAGLDAAGALHHQGFLHLGDLRDLHLLGVADAAQHRVRRRRGAQGMDQCRAHAGSRHRSGAPSP